MYIVVLACFTFVDKWVIKDKKMQFKQEAAEPK